jgi:hypothetical protein
VTTDLFGAEISPRRAIGSHESVCGGHDEWLTPPAIIDALGPFDLDPCAPIKRLWSTAATHYTIEDDGLRQSWAGRVWLNPPYSTAAKWLHRLADHDHGTALIFARTETGPWFRHVWPRASGLLFLQGRLTFHRADGTRPRWTSGAPSVLVAYGADDADRLRTAPLAGKFVAL